MIKPKLKFIKGNAAGFGKSEIRNEKNSTNQIALKIRIEF